MNYDRDILRVLAEAGHAGLSLRKITTHVYNRVNGLFVTVGMNDVRREVVNFMLRNTGRQDSPVEHTGERGVYRINKASGDTNQLMFDFKDHDDAPEEDASPVKDTSLSLF